MATNVILPVLGMAQDTGKIVQWLHAAGDQVQQGEPLAEIETDKVTVELESPATGTLASLSATAGEDVPVGQVIAVILAAGELPAGTPALATPVGAAVSVAADGHANGHPQTASLDTLLTAPARNGQQRLASPKAKRIAAERGLDIASIRGSGPNGVVLAADVLAAAAPTANGTHARTETLAGGSAPPAVAPPPEAQPAPVMNGSTMSTAWRIMAERTTQSWTTAPHFFLLREVVALSFKQWYAQAQKRASEKLTYTDLLVKVVATALRQHPRVNAAWINGTIQYNDAVNVGIAVATDDGLLVPVIVDADDLSLNAIARHRLDIVHRAQAGKLRPTDLQGGTFTVSNLGMYGIDSFNAIINAPQAAILAVGALADRVVAEDGQPVVRPMLSLSLSCDHRVIDGARGAQFLATVAELITDPFGL